MTGAFRGIVDDVRKLAEIFLAFIMTPAVAGAAAELINAGPTLATVIAGLGWLIVIARLASTGLELWERYFTSPPENAE